MSAHDSLDHAEALRQRGQICKENLLRCLSEWPVGELSMRIKLAMRPRPDQELVSRTLRDTLQWVKDVAACHTLQDVRLVYDVVRRLMSATIEAEYRDPAIDDANKAIDEMMSLLPIHLASKADVFIIMAMTASPELDDISEAIKEACKHVGFRAVRADDIPHSGLIAEVIKELITSAVFVIADLTFERPNVYQEIGIAQGRDKELILVRKQGTKVHSNLAGNNVEEYVNCVELKRLIIDRLQAMPRAA